MIYHVVTQQNWQIAQQRGFYAAESLALEGFIHCSTINQVKGVVERYYKNVPNLLLLHIDETKLTAPLKYELAPSINEEFPHIFGQLNLDAVVEVEELN
jgi:uncharacterized protein (DUF952 family)